VSVVIVHRNRLNSHFAKCFKRKRFIVGADMSVARNRVGCTQLDGCLYAVGGSDGSTHHRSIERSVAVPFCCK
jgi:hypothetical protein